MDVSTAAEGSAWARSRRPQPVCCVGLALALLLVALPARAQLHADRFGPFIVRSNVVAADVLPEETARRNGIPHKHGVGVLNVVIVPARDPSARTIEGSVRASVRNLLGQRQSIEMRPVNQDNRTSYIGTFPVTAAGRRLRFEIRVQPKGAAQSFVQRFSDRVFR
jgi:hypothetical protein